MFNFNIKILQRFQSKTLLSILNELWYINYHRIREDLQMNTVQNSYHEEFRREESVEFRDASLPGYGFGSRGIELSQVFGIGSC
jgi:hypothetical protein